MSSHEQCHLYVGKAVEYVCTLGNRLPVTHVRMLLADPAFRHAEAAVEAACLAGDVALTKSTCRAWWEVTRATIERIQQRETPPHQVETSKVFMV